MYSSLGTLQASVLVLHFQRRPSLALRTEHPMSPSDDYDAMKGMEPAPDPDQKPPPAPDPEVQSDPKPDGKKQTPKYRVANLELSDAEIDEANRLALLKKYHDTRIRVPAKLYGHIRDEAHRRRCSINSLITAALIRQFSSFESED